MMAFWEKIGMNNSEWPEQRVLRRMAERLLREWGRPVEWADDILQQVWLALRQVGESGEMGIISRPAYAAMVVRSVSIKRIQAETRAGSGLPEDLIAPSASDDATPELVAIAHRELNRLAATAVTPKQQRCAAMIRAIFDRLLERYETTGERVTFSEAYREMCGDQGAQSSEKALRYHFDKFKTTVLGTVHER